MRKFSVMKDKDGILRLALNNKPYFHNGMLDQGYYPDGFLTPPSNEAMKYDVETVKKWALICFASISKSSRFYGIITAM